MSASSKSGDAASIEIQNVNVPGRTTRVNAAKYMAMRSALLKVLPATTGGLTQTEMFAAVVPHLPDSLFPGGAKAGWWVKTVQLDLEARGIVSRTQGRPLQWKKVE